MLLRQLYLYRRTHTRPSIGTLGYLWAVILLVEKFYDLQPHLPDKDPVMMCN